ncbi:MAG: hypothetical protein LBI17_01660 [Rickettsiales bacterium]|jgi:hypothetical protein|nr:hypothetical protein [Rickettsiales bacterium]
MKKIFLSLMLISCSLLPIDNPDIVYKNPISILNYYYDKIYIDYGDNEDIREIQFGKAITFEGYNEDGSYSMRKIDIISDDGKCVIMQISIKDLLYRKINAGFPENDNTIAFLVNKQGIDMRKTMFDVVNMNHTYNELQASNPHKYDKNLCIYNRK